MRVSKIDLAGRTLDEVFEGIAPEKIACCNWPNEYPYTPDVTFKMFHTGKKLYVRFDVAEQYTAARIAENNGNVYIDSCCELFFKLDDKSYYNVECSCIGRMLIGYHPNGEKGVRADSTILSQVERITTLGTEPFEERIGDNRWSLILGLPTAVMFHHDIESWDGLKLRGNLYKCGDELTKPHFISWQPIVLPQPYFHCPQFFVAIELE